MAIRRIGGTAGVLLAGVATLLLVSAVPAAAHNELKSSTPAKGASLDAAPAAVVLTFAEDLIQGKTTITITGPDGASAATGEAQLAGPVATVPFKPTAAGAYTVAYKVTADDGDVTNTNFKFTLTAAAIAPPPTTTTTTTTTTTAPTTTAQPQPAAAASTDSGTTWWPWLVAGLAAVILIAVVLLILRRRATP